MLVAATALLTACAAERVDLDTYAHEDVVRQDQVLEQAHTIPLTIDQAVARALDKNLDARVAALESLAQQKSVSLADIRLLPQMEASAGRDVRSNLAASSSRSVATGLQSLEASQSSDRDRQTAELRANWNLLDVALALSDSRRASDEAGIAEQRLTKVIQNVERDVYVAYWRALAFQDLKVNADQLIKDAQAHMNKIDIARAKKLLSDEQAHQRISELSEQIQAFRDVKRQAELSQLELKSLLSYAPDVELKLLSQRRNIDPASRSLLNADMAKLETQALKARPEMREEILKRNQSIEDIRREVIQTFPGFNGIISRQYDSNDFLVNNIWNNLTLSVAQSITNLLTLPARLDVASSRSDVADARRQALSAAVIAQVHIARSGLAQSQSSYHDFERVAATSAQKARGMSERRKRGFATGENVLSSVLDAQTAKLRAGLAYADYQESYAAMRNGFGCSVTSLPQISQKGCSL